MKKIVSRSQGLRLNNDTDIDASSMAGPTVAQLRFFDSLPFESHFVSSGTLLIDLVVSQ